MNRKKILWIIGSLLPDLSDYLGEKKSGTTLCVKLSKQIRDDNNDLIIACATNNKSFDGKGYTINGIKYYLVYSKNDYRSYSTEFTNIIFEILQKENPDIIHIWGTENEYSFSSFRAIEQSKLIERTVISIQGLVSFISNHYCACLPWKTIYGKSFRDFIKGSSIAKEAYIFKKRGEYEQYVLRHCKYVIGRTDWDYATSLQVNPQLKYFECNETLRESFYNQVWCINKMRRHSIFVGSCAYPVKGFHIILEALNIVKMEFPDVHLFCPGANKMSNSIETQIKYKEYDLYIRDLIKKYELVDNVTFLGYLSEQEMLSNYLSANVFVSSSTIENSPNSVAEAMMVGTPVVASYVGGLQSMIAHGTEGFLYQGDAPYMLAYYISKIFNDDNLALSISNAARERANKDHDPIINYRRLMEIYSFLMRRK